MDDPKPASSDKNEQDVSNDLLDRPYDDKQPETYVTPTGEPTSITPMATPLSLQKPKSHSGRWLFRGIVVLLIAVLGAFGYWQWTEAQSASNERASLQSELETVKSANKATDKKEETLTDDAPSITTTSMAEELVAAYKKSLLSKDFTAKLTKISGEYALINVYRADSDSTTTYVYKNIDNNLVALASYDMDGWTESEASYYKMVYGIDAKSVGIPVGPASTM